MNPASSILSIEPRSQQRGTQRHKATLTCLAALACISMLSEAQALTTYSVPVEFDMTISVPSCTLSITSTGTATANAGTPTPGISAANTIDLNSSTTISSNSTPVQVVNALPNTTAFTASAAGLVYWSAGSSVARKLTSPPTGTINCSNGTPMTLTVTADASSPTASTTAAGNINGSATIFPVGLGTGSMPNLPVVALLGIASFAGTAGASGFSGTSFQPTAVAATSDGTAQAIAMTGAFYADSATSLGSSYAGLYTYKFNISLVF